MSRGPKKRVSIKNPSATRAPNVPEVRSSPKKKLGNKGPAIRMVIEDFVRKVRVVLEFRDPEGVDDFMNTQRAASEKIRILFLSANPHGTVHLDLDVEAREIEAKIRAAEHRDSLEFITKWATRRDDLLQYLNQHRPHIVHFSGHGSPAEELFLLDGKGDRELVSKAWLVKLFRALRDNIRVVVLNACYSQAQAEAITQEIDCAIGMTRAIGDDAAIAFAASFYRAIGFGRSVQGAFDQGILSLDDPKLNQGTTPVLMCRKNYRPSVGDSRRPENARTQLGGFDAAVGEQRAPEIANKRRERRRKSIHRS